MSTLYQWHIQAIRHFVQAQIYVGKLFVALCDKHEGLHEYAFPTAAIQGTLQTDNDCHYRHSLSLSSASYGCNSPTAFLLFSVWGGRNIPKHCALLLSLLWSASMAEARVPLRTFLGLHQTKQNKKQKVKPLIPYPSIPSLILIIITFPTLHITSLLSWSMLTCRETCDQTRSRETLDVTARAINVTCERQCLVTSSWRHFNHTLYSKWRIL